MMDSHTLSFTHTLFSSYGSTKDENEITLLHPHQKDLRQPVNKPFSNSPVSLCLGFLCWFAGFNHNLDTPCHVLLLGHFQTFRLCIFMGLWLVVSLCLTPYVPFFMLSAFVFIYYLLFNFFERFVLLWRRLIFHVSPFSPVTMTCSFYCLYFVVSIIFAFVCFEALLQSRRFTLPPYTHSYVAIHSETLIHSVSLSVP